MIRQKIYFLLICFSILMISCEDFFETSIEIEPPKYDKLLTIVGKANAGDAEVILKISETIGVLDNDSLLKGNSGVNVIAKLNNSILNVKEILGRGNLGNPEPRYAIEVPQKLKSGDKLSIEAKYKNLPMASVEAIIPAYPIVDNIKFTKDAGKNAEGDDISKLTFDYKTLEPNIYLTGYFVYQNINCSLREFKDGRYVCSKYDTSAYKQNINFQDPDTALEYYLKKSNTDQSKKEITMTFAQGLFDNNVNNNLYKPFVLLEIYGKDGYEYLVSAANYNNSYDNPFATPVNVKSNIVNGYGILLLSNSVRIDL
jgi:hypothetical protein